MKKRDRLKAAFEFAEMIADLFDPERPLPGPLPRDERMARCYFESWQDRWYRLTGIRPDMPKIDDAE